MTLPFALADVQSVTMFKRDELTTDLICCEVEVDGSNGRQVHLTHEEAPEWVAWLAEPSNLPGFDADWHAKVSQPVFEACVTEVYRRKVG